jgi:hypothetical protein
MDFAELKTKGFSDKEIQEALQEIEKEELTKSFGSANFGRSTDPRQFSQHSSFATKDQESLVKWQLELNDILERAEHILRGDKPTFRDGHLIWEASNNPKSNTLNEKGVQTIMNVLATYINRNTILSDYENDEIRIKVFDFGREVNNLIFMNYEEMGIDNEDKMNEYPILVRQLVDLVHSAYKRALKGGERRSLREMIQISQSQGLGTSGGITVNAGGGGAKERGLLNPMRYIAGKYK